MNTADVRRFGSVTPVAVAAGWLDWQVRGNTTRLRIAKFGGRTLLDFCGFFADNLRGRLVPMTICGVAA